jgi:hypothetical protein
MSGKTNLKTTWMPWLIVGLMAAAVTGIIYLFTMEFRIISADGWISSLISAGVTPSYEMVKYTTIEAINQFGGGETETVQFLKSALATSVGLFLILILVPWLFANGYRKLESEEEKFEEPVRSAGWYISATLLVLSILIAGTHAVTQVVIQQKNVQSADASRSLDELRSVMMDLAFDVSEQMIQSLSRSEEQRIVLESLPSYKDWETFDIEISNQESDSLITLTGIVVSGPASQNVDKKTITVHVTPWDDELFDYVN